MQTTKKILIFEDDASLSKACAIELKNNNFDVKVSETGEKAIDKINDYNPDAILLDLLMPTVGGFEVLKQIRNNPTHKDLPVIVLTNLDNIEDHFRAAKLNANDYILKSNTKLEDIVDVLNRQLSENGK